MADQTLVRYVNELRVLTHLRVNGAASRADLARALGLTPASITRLISEMFQRDLVRELAKGPRPETRELGRPSVSVTLNPDGAFFLGVEIGVGIVRFALLDLTASVVRSSSEPVHRNLALTDAVQIIAAYIADLERNPRFAGRIRSLCVTVPGIITLDGFIVHLPILGWRDVNLLEPLRRRISIPCHVENNANAAAFGSVYTRPDLPTSCTIFLKLGMGCGGAIITNGRLLKGGVGTAGELGHIRVSEHGERCSCGRIGCLETWVNLSALARAYGRGGELLDDAELLALPASVAAAADKGDATARAAIASVAHYLGLGIADIVNVFNPTLIIFGGVLRPVIERGLTVVRKGVESGIIPGVVLPDFHMSHLGDFECAAGAACVAHHRSFDISKIDIADYELRP